MLHVASPVLKNTVPSLSCQHLNAHMEPEAAAHVIVLSPHLIMPFPANNKRSNSHTGKTRALQPSSLW